MEGRIRTTHKEDISNIINLIKTLPKEEKKYLALEKKMAAIRREIKSGKHTYVLVSLKDGEIYSYARESGRPKKFVMLEEIVVHPDYREKGLGNKMLVWLLDKYPKMQAKTLSSNKPIIEMLKKNNFRIEKTSPKGNIIYWSHQ